MATRSNVHSRIRRLVLVVIVLAILAALVAGVATGARLYQHALALKQRLDRVQTVIGGEKGGGLGTETFKLIRAELAGGQQDFLALKQDLAPFLPLTQHLGWLPKIGPSVKAVPQILAMGEDFMGAGNTLLGGLEPLLDAMLAGKANDGTSRPSITERMLPPLLAAQPTFVEAQDLVERAVAERAQIDSAGLLPLLSRQLDRLDKYLPALRSACQGAAVSPILLGAVRPMNYLLVAQNNDELRPTGGFMSSIGILTLDKGRITRLDMKDSYVVDSWDWDHPVPPEPLQRYMEAELWVLRDTNFWPDLPTSAKTALSFAELDFKLKPDGLIMVDQLALPILIGGLGTVVIPEYNNDILTPDNVIPKMRAYWQPLEGALEQGEAAEGSEKTAWFTWVSNRKQFMSLLIQAMRTRLETETSSVNLPQFGKAVFQALNEKHILMYLPEPLGGGLAEGANWGGAVASTRGDYLFVVDTNMGFNKVNGLIKRSIDYSVAIDQAGLARGQVVVSYENPSTRDIACIHESYWEATYDMMMNRCYFNYLRLYAPEGSTLIADEDGNDMEFAGVESGKQVWATWLVVAPQEKPQVAVGYYQPGPVLARVGDNWEYRLTVQKQPGTDTTPLHITVSLPAGARVISASPAPKSIAGNVVQFESDLATDQEFRVVLR